MGAANERIVPMPDCDHIEICKLGETKSNYKKLLISIKDGIEVAGAELPKRLLG